MQKVKQKKKESQCDKLLRLMLVEKKVLTQWPSFEIHLIGNLKGRISDLRQRGWVINTEMKRTRKGGPKYAHYSMALEDQSEAKLNWLFENIQCG